MVEAGHILAAAGSIKVLWWQKEVLWWQEEAEMDKLLESSIRLSLNLQALSSKLGLVQNENQA